MAKNNMDRISHLPNSILHHILSFSNTKQVVQASLLSKRWNTLWTCIPTLNFEANAFSNAKSFKQFIFRVLSQHCGEDIQKISYSSTSNTKDAILAGELLICYARCHEVEELCLKTSSIAYYSWPCCLLDCKLLAVLKITCGFVEDWGALKLPSLRILEIHQCEGDSNDLNEKYKGNKMFSGCPNLESLILINYLAKSACICVPELEYFELCVSSKWKLTFPQVELCMPNLKSVKFSNVLPALKSSVGFSCINNVNIEVKDCNFESGDSRMQKLIANFGELLRVFHNARSFTLPSKAIEVLLSVSTTSFPGFYFPNLRHLKLKTKEVDKPTSINLPISTLTFLQSCLNLETLAVHPNQE